MTQLMAGQQSRGEHRARLVAGRAREFARGLVPTPVLARRALRGWDRADPPQWPLPGREHLDDITRWEYSVYSQNGEDGILRHLTTALGIREGRFLEFGFSVSENNSLRLALLAGWAGTFVDGNSKAVRIFNRAAETKGIKARARREFVTLENIAAIVGRAGDLDLLSIDLDGNDYHFWEATDAAPPIVAMEYNPSFGPSDAVTVPYDPTFIRYEKHWSGFYHGASLAALEKLGKAKGYALVGCDSQGANAFFVLRECRGDLREVRAADAFRDHGGRLRAGYTWQAQRAVIEGVELVHV